MLKRILIVLTLIGLVAPTSFAEQGKAAGTKGPAAFPFKSQTEYSIVGQVVSVMPADPARGVKPSVTLAAEDGGQITFLIHKTTTIYARDLKAIKPAELRPGSRVRIRYRMDKDGYKEALSISEQTP